MLQRASVSEVLNAEGRRLGRQRWLRYGFIAAAVLVGGTIAWIVGSSMLFSGSQNYASDAVALGDLKVVLTETGTLAAEKQIDVASATTGTIVSVDVDYNQIVKAGQPLAHLDPKDLRSTLDHAQALVEAQISARDVARSVVADAEAALRRMQELPQGQVVSAKDTELAASTLDRARDNLAGAEAQLTARAELASAQSGLDKAVIASPIDGIVMGVNVEAGESIGAATAGLSLFTIASDIGRLNLEIDVGEADVAQVKAGQQVAFTIEAQPDAPFTATIAQVRDQPTVIEGVVSYKAIVGVDNTADLFRPGMTATADITVGGASKVLTIANSALRFAPPTAARGGLFAFLTPQPKVDAPPSRPHVWVLREGQLHPVAVTTGVTDGQRTQVSGSGIKAGDIVVTGIKGR